MLLGDTGNPTGMEFIKPAIEDPDARKYIGAVSFHSWHGGTDAQLKLWGDAARKLNLPLFSAEGGTDPDAWNYPAVFEEPWFALDEIRLYVRICSLSQPRSVIHWQLTADYSVLAGGGNQPLRPTQRFWNLKQLGATPAGSNALPITSDKPSIIPCAYVNSKGTCTVHLINSGASRPATVTGLPAGVKEFRVHITDATRGMKELPRVPVSNGTAQLTLEPATFTTLMSTQ
jgi:hypothetical protein